MTGTRICISKHMFVEFSSVSEALTMLDQIETDNDAENQVYPALS
jgi:hypothetical protein